MRGGRGLVGSAQVLGGDAGNETVAAGVGVWGEVGLVLG